MTAPVVAFSQSTRDAGPYVDRGPRGYKRSDETIYRVLEPATEFATDNGPPPRNPNGIAVDRVSVYWVNTVKPSASSPVFGSVMKCAVGGCNNHPTILASHLSDPYDIAVDSTSVYWTNRLLVGSVMKCAIDGCNDLPTQLASYLPGPGQSPTAIAVDSVNVYWTSTGAVMRVAK
jgi:hypothetical protein